MNLFCFIYSSNLARRRNYRNLSTLRSEKKHLKERNILTKLRIESNICIREMKRRKASLRYNFCQFKNYCLFETFPSISHQSPIRQTALESYEQLLTILER